jgi:hypothetical protein
MEVVAGGEVHGRAGQSFPAARRPARIDWSPASRSDSKAAVVSIVTSSCRMIVRAVLCGSRQVRTGGTATRSVCAIDRSRNAQAGTISPTRPADDPDFESFPLCAKGHRRGFTGRVFEHHWGRTFGEGITAVRHARAALHTLFQRRVRARTAI